MLPSTLLSFWPVTVTVCAEFQLLVVNVKLAGEALPSVMSLLVIEMVTLLEGWLFKTIVKFVDVPSSEVVSPEFGDTVMPATGSGGVSLS